jgi:hypothetical protein
MTKNLMAIISAAIFLFLVAAAVKAWRSRIAQQSSSFAEPLEALEFFGELIASAKGFYVATTFALNHLERIAAYGLGARGVAQALVFTEGILIVRNGERPLAIDRANIKGVVLGQTTIDKSVEAAGLLQIDWQQNAVALTTHLRFSDPTMRDSIFKAISNITMKEESK